jgi:hypothetical protein
VISCSVIVCTWNPLPENLNRVLTALRTQNLPQDQWELIVVDSASSPPLAPRFDLSWHPLARCVREEAPGLFNARILGARESSAPLIVFVDDDNVLDGDYLAQALDISTSWPQVTVWSGQSHPEFQTPPPEWTRSSWPLLALAQFDNDQISSQWHLSLPLPFGAGMCVRRSTMTAYLDNAEHSPARASLGRGPGSLMSADDNDIALSALESGQSIGRFTSLQLTHLIPPSRLTRDYLLRLIAAMAASREILTYLHPQFPYSQPTRLPHFVRVWRHFLRPPSWERSQKLATLKGEKQGLTLVRTLHQP